MNNERILIGWREWVSLPDLGISRIKAKIDTGARSSSLHAFQVDRFEEHGLSKVRFAIHPRQYTTKKAMYCTADLIDIRWVSDSGGHKEKRCVIKTTVLLGEVSFAAEVTLANRDDMRFRMLLGRTALSNLFWIDASVSYLTKKINLKL